MGASGAPGAMVTWSRAYASCESCLAGAWEKKGTCTRSCSIVVWVRSIASPVRMPWYTDRVSTHTDAAEPARTVAVRGVLYSRANSPKSCPRVITCAGSPPSVRITSKVPEATT